MKKSIISAFIVLEIFVTVFRGRIIYSAQSPVTNSLLVPVEISLPAAIKGKNDVEDGVKITLAGRTFDTSVPFPGEEYPGKLLIFRGSLGRKNTPDLYPLSKTAPD